MATLDEIPDLDTLSVGDLHQVRNAILKEVLVAVGGGGGGPLATEATALLIKAAVEAMDITVDNIDLTNTTLTVQTDDLEQLNRDTASYLGGVSEDSGTPAYTEVLDVTAVLVDGVTALTLSAALLTNYESVARAGDLLRLSGTSPNPGVYRILTVDTLTVTIDAVFAHALTAGVGFTIPDTTDAQSLNGILKSIRSGLGGATNFQAPDLAPTSLDAVPGIDPVHVTFNTLDATIDFRRDLFPGQQVKVAGTAPTTGIFNLIDVDTSSFTVAVDPSFSFASGAGRTVQPVGRSALLNRLVSVMDTEGLPPVGDQLLMLGVLDDSGNNSRIFQGPDGGLLIEDILPSAVIDETALTHATPGTVTSPFVGTPKRSVTIQNDPGNTGDLSIGNSVSQNTVLIPGASITGFEIDDLSRISIKNTVASQKVNVFGS